MAWYEVKDAGVGGEPHRGKIIAPVAEGGRGGDKKRESCGNGLAQGIAGLKNVRTILCHGIPQGRQEISLNGSIDA